MEHENIQFSKQELSRYNRHIIIPEFGLSAQKKLKAAKVLVIGSPLPALPGKEYVLHDTLLLPCGYEFDPPAISNLVITRLDPSKGSLLLFDINVTIIKRGY